MSENETTTAIKADVEMLRADLANLKASLTDLASDTAAHARGRVHRAGERAREAFDATKDKVRETAGAAAERGKEYYDAAADKTRAAVDTLEERIEERPLTSVGIAFGVGLLLGVLLSGRR
jgi:ElaB/YqjD/DUF883 family membrane-anchored ribosome-binding protein